MFDLLITDYSSIYIDYLLTDSFLMISFLMIKNVILDGRGMNFDYEEVTPGPKPKTMKEFTEELRAFCSERIPGNRNVSGSVRNLMR